MSRKSVQNILVVDPDQDARDTICLTLQRAGFEVLVATTGAAAVEQVRIHGATIALALLEMSLGDMDGEATFTSIHELQPDLHVLLFTGEFDPEVLQRLLDTGYCTHLGKPCPLAVLLEEVHWLVSLYPRTQRA